MNPAQTLCGYKALVFSSVGSDDLTSSCCGENADSLDKGTDTGVATDVDVGADVSIDTHVWLQM